MKFAIFGYTTPNLGDDVQALAAACVLPSVDAYVYRDRLDQVHLTEPHHVIMNSWFAVKRYEAVPSPSLLPIYFGQCIGRPELLNQKWLAHWRAHQPIGCRDLHTLGLLRQNGVEAFYTGCLTAWIGRSIAPPDERKGVYFVDVPQHMETFIPESIRNRAIRISNETAKGQTNQKQRFIAAARILDRIRTAELVVTRRLHTAIPCIGFGTPVTVYLASEEKNRQRFSGPDAYVPIIFHNEAGPIGDTRWLDPARVTLPSEVEDHYLALLKRLGHTEPRVWKSVEALAMSLPDMPVEPRRGLARWLT